MRRRTMMLSIAAVAGGGAIALRRGSQAPGESWRSRMSSHDALSHDSIDSLGYDWERVANRSIAPRYPRKIYLPRCTDDVVEAVREARSLGETLKIRSKGHSSNDLVLTDGSVLLTEKLDTILSVDERAMTVTVQSGTQLATIDDHLAPAGSGCRSSEPTITSRRVASRRWVGSARRRIATACSSTTWCRSNTWAGTGTR